MCHQYAYTLVCEHVYYQPAKHCSRAPRASKGKDRKVCHDVSTSWDDYPPPAATCQLKDCPYEKMGRHWNCCWCGKAGNDVGRCSCVMIVGGGEYRCEHICCVTCEPASKR